MRHPGSSSEATPTPQDRYVSLLLRDYQPLAYMTRFNDCQGRLDLADSPAELILS
jgi:hypothetical protein